MCQRREVVSGAKLKILLIAANYPSTARVAILEKVARSNLG